MSIWHDKKEENKKKLGLTFKLHSILLYIILHITVLLYYLYYYILYYYTTIFYILYSILYPVTYHLFFLHKKIHFKSSLIGTLHLTNTVKS